MWEVAVILPPPKPISTPSRNTTVRRRLKRRQQGWRVGARCGRGPGDAAGRALAHGHRYGDAAPPKRECFFPANAFNAVAAEAPGLAEPPTAVATREECWSAQRRESGRRSLVGGGRASAASAVEVDEYEACGGSASVMAAETRVACWRARWDSAGLCRRSGCLRMWC